VHCDGVARQIDVLAHKPLEAIVPVAVSKHINGIEPFFGKETKKVVF
jgi:hypothetical protein